MNKIFFVFVFIFTMSGCSQNRFPIKPAKKQVNFTILPFPTDMSQVGQIVELYTKPNNVITTYSPPITRQKIHIYNAWNISDSGKNIIKEKLQADIIKILKSKYTFASKKNIEISFTNTQIKSMYKYDLLNSIKNTLKDNKMIREHIVRFRRSKWRTKYDVVIKTLSADISFKLTDSSGHIVAIDPSIIRQLNKKLRLYFINRNGEKITTSSKLVIAIYTDPDMINMLIKQYEIQ